MCFGRQVVTQQRALQSWKARALKSTVRRVAVARGIRMQGIDMTLSKLSDSAFFVETFGQP